MKEWLIHQSELGLSLSLDAAARSVCAACIADEALRLFVSRAGRIDSCAFCGATAVDGTTVETLFEYMAGCLAEEWDDPNNCVGWDGREGGWMGAAVLDSDELLQAVDEPLGNEELRSLFATAFEREWCQRDPYGLRPDERLHLSWAAFANCVKHERRYLFLRPMNSSANDPELIDPADMLDELGKALLNVHHRLIQRLPAGSRVVRARDHSPDERPTGPGALGSPPVHLTRATRMSPAGIPMFYGAEDVTTALAELHPGGDRWATVATWKTARDLRYLDLAGLPPVPSVFDMTARIERPWLLFLRRFAEAIAQPATATADVDYVPTQVMTEYVRDVLADYDGTRLDGIRYRSAAAADGVCWVIFADPSQCVDDTETPPSAGLLRIDNDTTEVFEPWWRPAL